MLHIYTYDEIRQEFEDRDYILITDHKLKCSEKYEYVCRKHADKGLQLIDWRHFHYNKRGCYYCGRERTIAARKKDLSEFHAKELAESKGFEYVDVIRRDSKIYVLFICPKHREYGVQEMWYFNMQRDITGCQHCIGRNDSEEHVLREMHEANPNIVLLDQFCGRTGRVRAFCTIHNMVTYTTPSNIIKGKGCYNCGLEKLSAFHKMPDEVYRQMLAEKQPDILLLEGYDGATSVVKARCKLCNYQWNGIAYYILEKGCPNCCDNTTESKVGEILKNHSIAFIRQFSFDDCRDKKPLPFDYYLPDYNILIEYDGEGHYMPINFGGMSGDEAVERMLYTQRHDMMKTEYCKNNSVPLIRIPYWEKNNLEEYLIKQLKQYELK